MDPPSPPLGGTVCLKEMTSLILGAYLQNLALFGIISVSAWSLNYLVMAFYHELISAKSAFSILSCNSQSWLAVEFYGYVLSVYILERHRQHKHDRGPALTPNGFAGAI